MSDDESDIEYEPVIISKETKQNCVVFVIVVVVGLGFQNRNALYSKRFCCSIVQTLRHLVDDKNIQWVFVGGTSGLR